METLFLALESQRIRMRSQLCLQCFGRWLNSIDNHNLGRQMPTMHNQGAVEDRVVLFIYYYYYMCHANYGASEEVNLCSRYVEKSTNCSEQKCASYFRE
jgi:hypothetical protein